MTEKRRAKKRKGKRNHYKELSRGEIAQKRVGRRVCVGETNDIGETSKLSKIIRWGVAAMRKWRCDLKKAVAHVILRSIVFGTPIKDEVNSIKKNRRKRDRNKRGAGPWGKMNNSRGKRGSEG